jgi:hypothetical protein
MGRERKTMKEEMKNKGEGQTDKMSVSSLTADSCDTTPNTTSCVLASPDVSQAPAEAPQPTKAAKKRSRKALKTAFAKITEGLKDMKAVPLNGNLLTEAKAADEAKARQIVIDGVQADAVAVAEKWVKYSELCEAEDEAKRNRIVFRENFEGDAALRKRWQNVRDFFVKKKKHEFVTGKDGTQYFTLPKWCEGECGVTYEYLRRLDPRFAKLKNQIAGRQETNPADLPEIPAGKDESENPTLAESLADSKPTFAIRVSPADVESNSVKENSRLILGYARSFGKLMTESEWQECVREVIKGLQYELPDEAAVQVTMNIVPAEGKSASV